MVCFRWVIGAAHKTQRSGPGQACDRRHGKVAQARQEACVSGFKLSQSRQRAEQAEDAWFARYCCVWREVLMCYRTLMNLPDLNLLITLDAVLSEGSVAGAARRLGLSP